MYAIRSYYALKKATISCSCSLCRESSSAVEAISSVAEAFCWITLSSCMIAAWICSAPASCSLLAAEMRSYHGPGTCTFYGTANSNQMLMEVMGLHIPGSAFVKA